jgi:hypothetical protein
MKLRKSIELDVSRKAVCVGLAVGGIIAALLIKATTKK